MDLAVLLHLVRWNQSSEKIYLSKDISLQKMDGSPVEKLYRKMCLEDGLDNGEPFDYYSYALIESGVPNVFSLDFNDPYSPVARLCNVIAIITSQPIAFVRLIWSKDNFTSYDGTERIYEFGEQMNFLFQFQPILDEETCIEISKAWHIADYLWQEEKSRGRIEQALIFFYYAWRSHYMDLACINLSVVLEILFAPHYQSETSHQISYNLSRFLGDTEEKRRNYFKQTKDFYSIRSRIIHGGVPKDDKVVDLTIGMFHLIARILKMILMDDELARIFNDNRLRKELIESYLFN